MSNVRSRWSGRVVEVEEIVIGRRQDDERGGELGDRCPPEDSVEIAVLGEDAVRSDDRSGGMVGAPAVDPGEDGIDVGNARRC